LRNALALLILLAATAVAQTQGRAKVIVWSGDKECGRAGQQITCEALETPRGPVNVITDRPNDVSLAVSFFEDDDFIIAATHLKNTSKEALSFDSDLWGAAHFSKKENARSGGKPIVAETAIPSRDLLRGIRAGAARDSSADTFMASITKAGEVREVRQQDGTRKRQLVIVDDKQAVSDASMRTVSRREHSNSAQERIRKHALTQKTVPAEGSVRGLVYFRRVKKADVVVFSFRVLDSIYVFRLLRKT
jgi:hypothetical protein